MSQPLDLLLSTNRWNPYAKAYISYLASFTKGNPDVHLYVSDNSYNLEKQRFLESLGLDNLCIHTDPSLGVHSNFQHVFDMSRSPYVMAVADDDWYHVDYFKVVDILRNDPKVSAAVGPIGLVQEPQRFIVYPENRFMIDDPVERARDYTFNCLEEIGLNWTMFGAVRRSVYTLYMDYVKIHPFEFWFRDQMAGQAAALLGQIKGTSDGFMYYQTRTAKGLEEKMHKEHARLTEVTGVLPWIQCYYHYWLACEYATFYLWKGNTLLPNREANADAIFKQVFNIFIKTYVGQQKVFEDHFQELGIAPIMHKLFIKPTARLGLEGLQIIFNKMNAETGKTFKEFMDKELVSA